MIKQLILLFLVSNCAIKAILVNAYKYQCGQTKIYLLSDVHAGAGFKDSQPVDDQITVIQEQLNLFKEHKAKVGVFVEGDKTLKQDKRHDFFMGFYKKIECSDYPNIVFKDESDLRTKLPHIHQFLDARDLAQSLFEGIGQQRELFKGKDPKELFNIIQKNVNEKLKGLTFPNLADEFKDKINKKVPPIIITPQKASFAELYFKAQRYKDRSQWPEWSLVNIILPPADKSFETKADRYIKALDEGLNAYREKQMFLFVQECQQEGRDALLFAGDAHIQEIMKRIKGCTRVETIEKNVLDINDHSFFRGFKRNVEQKKLTHDTFPVLTSNDLKEFFKESHSFEQMGAKLLEKEKLSALDRFIATVRWWFTMAKAKKIDK